MEITAEIKSKIFAQYLGEKILFAHQQKWLDGMFCTTSTLTNLERGLTTHTGLKLILKPLSEITHEDTFKLAQIFFVDVSYINKIIASIKLNIPIQSYTPKQMFEAYQYLISKGYDLPNHFLKGKTLFDCEIAIYEK